MWFSFWNKKLPFGLNPICPCQMFWLSRYSFHHSTSAFTHHITNTCISIHTTVPGRIVQADRQQSEVALTGWSLSSKLYRVWLTLCYEMTFTTSSECLPGRPVSYCIISAGGRGRGGEGGLMDVMNSLCEQPECVPAWGGLMRLKEVSCP